jgi:hypothetical protein
VRHERRAGFRLGKAGANLDRHGRNMGDDAVLFQWAASGAILSPRYL